MKSILNNLFLICLVGYLDAVKFRCDYTFNKVGWFKYHKIPATWRDARLQCRYEGAVLASPVSNEIKTAMMNTTQDIAMFTGMHAISSGTYRSVDGTALESFTHEWAENEPDNKGNVERCIAFNFEGQLSDVSCEEPRPYMCYRAYSTVGANACGTPDKDYHYYSKLRKCYKFHTFAKTFDQADFVCTAEGGHLAILNSDAESRAMYNIFPKDLKQIRGANRTDVAFVGFLNVEGDWTTIHGQSLVQAGFAKFFPGEPNGKSGEACGSVFRNGYFDDVWCNIPLAFICEKKVDSPPVCESDNM